MELKKVRKMIRECENQGELYALREHLENKGIKFLIKRWNQYEPIDSNNCNLFFEDDGSIYIQLPPAWSCGFKNIKMFSYNIKIKKGNKPTWEENFYVDKLRDSHKV